MENENMPEMAGRYNAARKEKDEMLRLLDEIFDDLWILHCKYGIDGLTPGHIPEDLMQRRGGYYGLCIDP
jgi:hypothetical protein